MSDDDLVDVVNRHMSTFNGGFRGDGAKLGGVEILEGAAVTANGGPSGTQNDYVTRGHNLSLYQTIVQ